MNLSTENFVRVMAGSFVLIGLALGVWVNSWWLCLPAFVGVNLIQSAFTGFCPASMIYDKVRKGN
ncbi:MAG: DUF2892 domain-containing protein [Verrucomicrobiota bacterium]|nr:DUF2892 domain-containing protein [Verrucomicrobiota bacterium]